MRPIPFGIRTLEGDDPAISAENLINLFADQAPGKQPMALRQSPGMPLYKSVGSGPIRGEWEDGGTHYVVSGTELYKGTTSANYTLIGTIPGSGLVGMATNDRETGPQLMVVNGTATGYAYTESGGLASVALTGPAYTVVYQDGYFVFDWAGTGKWFVSSVNNGEQYISTEVGATNARPDKVLAVIPKNDHMWVLGEKSIEIHENSGSFDFPYSRIRGVTIEDVGIGSRDSLVHVDNALYFVGNDREVYRSEGYAVKIVSDSAVTEALKDIDLSAINGFGFKRKTHAFYQINLPTISYRFDAKTSLWSIVSYFDGKHKRDKGQTYCYFNGQHLVGDYQNGNIYTYSDTVQNVAGQPIKREMITPFLHAQQNQAVAGRLIADMKMGGGNVLAEDPVIMMEFSDDGETWSTPMPGLVGSKGKKKTQIWWDGLGTYYQRAYKIWWTDQFDTTLLGLYHG